MATNDDRRRALADAGLAILAEQGARGLTHRAVDRAAAVPLGTCSNYFRSRSELILGLVARVGERLAPSAEFLEAHRDSPPSRAVFTEYLRDIVDRLLAAREVTLALFELRLEGVRRPEVGELISAWSREGFAGDVAFNAAAGLPGGRAEIALFRYAVDGLLLDRLTGPVDPETSTDAIVDALVEALLPEE